MTTEPLVTAGAATAPLAPEPPAAAPRPAPIDDSRRRRGLRVPARVRIMAWLVLVMASGLASVVLLVGQFEYRAIDQRVARGLLQDAEEFQNFARVGLDPATDSAIMDATTLFERYLTVQSTDRAEVLLGIDVIDSRLEVIRVIDDSVAGFQVTDELMAAIIAEPRNTGVLQTASGELRWIRTGVVDPALSPDSGGAPSVASTVPPATSELSDGDAPTSWFVGGYLIAEARAEADATVRTLIAVCAVALVLGAGISWLVAGQILLPVRTVRRAAAEISEEDLTRRIPVDGRDDISALADQFNAMLDRLEQAFSTRRRFLDDAGHELRTPITIVRGHLELMGSDPEERAETVRICTDELDRMARIVDDMLLLAKTEQSDFVQIETVPIHDLTSDIEAKARAIADRRWTLVGVGEGTAQLDPHRITQAMLQLAQNAAQHTGIGDRIEIGSTVQDGAVLFWVTDSGHGVPEAEIGSIFERFRRGSSSGGDRRGAGLGLAIVAAIAEAHRGRAWVVSEPGHGACFGLELPVTAS